MNYEGETLFYHSSYRGDKKSRYTVSGKFNQDGTLSLAYARRGLEDNFSKEEGRNLSTKRLNELDEKFSRTIQIEEISRSVFISEAKKFTR